MESDDGVVLEQNMIVPSSLSSLLKQQHLLTCLFCVCVWMMKVFSPSSSPRLLFIIMNGHAKMGALNPAEAQEEKKKPLELCVFHHQLSWNNLKVVVMNKSLSLSLYSNYVVISKWSSFKTTTGHHPSAHHRRLIVLQFQLGKVLAPAPPHYSRL